MVITELIKELMEYLEFIGDVEVRVLHADESVSSDLLVIDEYDDAGKAFVRII